jgi:alpha-L-arabinofuranosidase
MSNLNNKIMSVANSAREFFYQINQLNSEELLVHMDIISMLKLIQFGRRMLNEAQANATKHLILGETLDANAIARDVSVIAKNLKTLEDSYKLALN